MLVALLVTGALVSGSAPLGTAAPPAGWASAEADRLVTDANFPTDIDMAPDGSIWYTELAGNVSRFDRETGQSEHVHHVPNVVTGRERGLVGLALAHDFATTGAFYLYYSERTDDPDGGMNHLVRIEDGQETRLASLTAWLEHNGGRIVVAPNGTLFVGTGENAKHDPAQDLDSLLGKILHLTPNGEPVDGNLKGLVYSYGHRNVYGLAQDPDTGTLWAMENMGWRRDEANIVEPGGNHGYPECEGEGLHGVDEPCPRDKGYVFPIMTFYEDRAAAPTGAAFWRGDFYWASFNEGTIHHIWWDEAADEWRDAVVYEHDTRVLDLLVGQDDALYFSALDGVWRIWFPEVEGDDGTPGPASGDPTPKGGAGKTIAAPSMALAMILLAGASWWASKPRRS